MSEVEGMLLTDLPGVGSCLAERMISQIGGVDEVWDAVKLGDIEKLAEVDGLSGNRALGICRAYANNEFDIDVRQSNEGNSSVQNKSNTQKSNTQKSNSRKSNSRRPNSRGTLGPFLATSEAEKVHQKLLAGLISSARNKVTANRLKLLMPFSLSRSDELMSRRKLISQAMEFTSKEAELAAQIRSILADLSRLNWPQLRCERVVVCADDALAERLEPLKKWCRVLRISSEESWKDYTVFSQVTWVGDKGPRGKIPENWSVLAGNAPLGLVLPERTIAWAKHNLKTLKALSSIRRLSFPVNSEGVVMADAKAQTAAKPAAKTAANADVEAKTAEKTAAKSTPSDQLDLNPNETPITTTMSNSIINAVKGLATLSSVINDVGAEGDTSESLQLIKDELWKVAKQIEKNVQTTVSEGMADAQLSLQGSDMLDMLADANLLQRRIASATEEVIDSAVTEANNELSEFLGQAGINLPRGIFSSAWPPKLDRSALEKIEIEIDNRLVMDKTQATLRLARNLTPLIESCESAVKSLVEIDAWLTIADHAQQNNCVMPEMVRSGVWVDAGRHLFLGIEPDPVTYGIGQAAKLKSDRQSVALLTGANSGGKTTLLEMLAQITILAHMGLPVPAKSARVGHIEKLHIIAKASGTQSAGALEQTLRKLAEVLTTPGKRLVLADELEAITEPGAAARILAGMFGAAIDHPDISMLTVTHLAPQLLKASGRDLRVDGIEARGLDENLELIVDRTPIRNHLARSTPELIVRRLVEQCEGDAQVLFTDILASFPSKSDSPEAEKKPLATANS